MLWGAQGVFPQSRKRSKGESFEQTLRFCTGAGYIAAQFIRYQRKDGPNTYDH